MRVEIINRKEDYIEAQSMNVGQVGVSDKGKVFLRTYAGVISLSDPADTYFSTACVEKVIVLSPGTKIQLTTDI